MNYFIAIMPIAISLLSLIISIKLYTQNTPKLIIEIKHESDAFYGATSDVKNGEKILSHYMAGVNMRIKNASPKSIMIGEISLNYNKNNYELADNSIDAHKEKIFYYISENEITFDGTYICYSEFGIKTPFIISSYETKDITALFLFFPKNDEKYLKAKLILDTAIGKKVKKVKLSLYDEQFISESFLDIDKCKKSL